MLGLRNITMLAVLGLMTIGIIGTATAVTIGTPPAAGQLIEEVATSSASFNQLSRWMYPGLSAEWILELPLPVFASTGQAAVPEQCLWSTNITEFYYPHSDPDVEILVTELEHRLEGPYLLIYATSNCTIAMSLFLSLEIFAVAIKTTEPVKSESTTISQVKEIYR